MARNQGNDQRPMTGVANQNNNYSAQSTSNKMGSGALNQQNKVD